MEHQCKANNPAKNLNLDEEIPLVVIEKSLAKLQTIYCENISESINFLNSSRFSDQLKTSNVIIPVKFKVSDNSTTLSEDELNKLSEKFKNESIVILLTSSITSMSSIYWKSREIDKFLTLKPHRDDLSKNDEVIYEIAVNMITDSLNCGHLGLQSTNESQNVVQDANSVEIFQLIDHRGYNLLLYACEKGIIDAAIYLYKLGMDTEVIGKNIKAQNLASQNGHYELILAMYKENMTLPALIDISTCSEEFKNFTQNITELNLMIVEDNLTKVEEIFNQLPRTNYCYNLANESALKIATINRAFNCYDFFLSEGLRFAPHETPEQYYEELELNDKRHIRQIHEKYTQEMQEQHINILLSKSLLSHDVPDSKEKLKFVQRAYEALSANVLIKIILMVIAASKDFKIIFDFNREAVNVADPTTTSATQGIFYLSGKIYIGAKQLLDEATSHETLAVMAHEFCHFAMKIVYGNKAKPYKKDDLATMEKFKEISDKCFENYEDEDVIGSVYKHYPDELCHAELIVRVVHLLALYWNQPEKLEQVRRTFGCLFDFYEHKVVPEMKEALPEIKGRAEKEIEEKIVEKDKKILRFKAVSVVVAILSIILIVFGVIVTKSIFYKPDYKFNDLLRKDQIRVENAKIFYKNVEIEFHDLFPVNSSIYHNLTSDHISHILDGKSINFDDPHLRYLNDQVKLSWKLLARKLKHKFLNSKLNFQNQSIRFGKLHDKVPKAFEFLNSEKIVDVLSGKELIVDNKLQIGVNF